jgi:ABC-type transport system substrate-binding protein
MGEKHTMRLLAFGISVFLIQFTLWVVPYDLEAKDSTERLGQFIEASIADAQILNPILSTDAASSAIASRVFEGLIDRDENLHFRGRLATHWEVYEEAYFHVNEGAGIPRVGKADAKGVVRFLHKAIRARKAMDDPVSKSLANIKKVEALPARTFEVAKQEEGPGGERVAVTIRVAAPAKIRMVLRKVDRDLFDHLSELLGKEYFSSFDGARFIDIHPKAFLQKREIYATQLLPATEHNPLIVFHLRPNVKFHDGHVFDAGDVKFTYEAIMDPRNQCPRMPDYELVRKVDIIDPLTVRIVYKEIYSAVLSTWAIGILPAHLLGPRALRDEAERLGRDPKTFTLRHSQFNRNPIGCGPFKFKEWKPGNFIKLERFGDYWGGAPEYKEYICRIIPDVRAQAGEFLAGGLDIYGGLPLEVEGLKKDKRFQSFSGLSYGYTFIGYNMRREPFKDSRVRRALGMAIDVDSIIEKVVHGQGERVAGPFPKQADFYNPSIGLLPFDPKGALRLLAEAGWKRGRGGWLWKDGRRMQFTLITHQENRVRRAIASIARDAWRKIGIDARIEVLDWRAFIKDRVNRLDFDALILGWAMGIEPDLYPIWHSSQTQPNQLNFVGFQNHEADDLIIKIRQEFDHDKQVAYCNRLHEIIADEQPYTFLFVDKWTVFLDRRIVIKDVDPRGKTEYRRIKPTKRGDYGFHFNKWVKLPELPDYLRQ